MTDGTSENETEGCPGGCHGTGYVWRDVYVIDGWSVDGDWCPVCRPGGKSKCAARQS